jgi:gliding motility-associated lipoprotein GldD
MTFKYSLLFIVFSLLVFSCGSDSATVPKPRAFPRIIFPEKGYSTFKEVYCDFSFEAPVSAQIVQDTSFFDQVPEHPCWFDIYYPTFEGRIHCSYRPIDNENSFEVLMQDAFNMAGWHNKKANYIEEMLIQNDQGVGGFAFEMKGPAASPFQFFLSDSTNHFFRGALYFNTQARPDSLAPVYEFVREDLMKIIETFEWK